MRLQLCITFFLIYQQYSVLGEANANKQSTDASAHSLAAYDKTHIEVANDNDGTKEEKNDREPKAEFQERYNQAMSILYQYHSNTSSTRPPSPVYRGLRRNQDVILLFPKSIRPYIRRITNYVADLIQPSKHKSQTVVRAAWNSLPISVQESINTLRELSNSNYVEAIYTLAEIEMYGKYGVPVNTESAFKHYVQLSDLNGNATAQYMVGFFYSTGLGGVQASNSMSLLYNTFSAMQGYTPAEMVLGYRHLVGIGTSMDCDSALEYYRSVAVKTIKHYLSGPPLGRHLPGYRVRISDEDGGVYGVKTINRAFHKLINREEFNEIVEFHRFRANKGDLQASMALADLYYHGHRYMPQKFTYALKYLSEILGRTFGSNGKLRGNLSPSDSQVAAQAAGMFGIMHWRGEGVSENPKTAFKWFSIGAELGNGASFNALGKMYQDGVIVPKSAQKAQSYFKKAAEKQHPGGQVNLALHVIDNTPDLARVLLVKAAESGNLLAHYYLGEIFSGGIGVDPLCSMAVVYYRHVAENGDWLHSPIQDAYNKYRRGEVESAIVEYMRSAEMGYSVGQLNSAYLLEKGSGLYLDEEHNGDSKDVESCMNLETEPSSSVSKEQDYKDKGNGRTPEPVSNGNNTSDKCTIALFRTAKERDFQALAYWTRAANQGVLDARVKQGDYYFYGMGVANNTEKAAAAYTIAAENEHNSFAMWNLGWMYENGIGVKRDFHLAKRWYDSSLETNDNGRLANHFSLARLCIKYLWGWARGEDVEEGPLFFAPKPIADEEDNERGKIDDNKHDDEDDEEAVAARIRLNVGSDHEELDLRHAKHQRSGNRRGANGNNGYDRNGRDMAAGDDARGNDRDNMRAMRGDNAGDIDAAYAEDSDDEDDDEGTFTENVFFGALFLLVGWVFLRNQQQQQQQQQQQIQQ